MPFEKQKVLNFDKIQFIDFSFYSLCFLCLNKKIFAKSKVIKIFSYVFMFYIFSSYI